MPFPGIDTLTQGVSERLGASIPVERVLVPVVDLDASAWPPFTPFLAQGNVGPVAAQFSYIQIGLLSGAPATMRMVIEEIKLFTDGATTATPWITITDISVGNVADVPVTDIANLLPRNTNAAQQALDVREAQARIITHTQVGDLTAGSPFPRGLPTRQNLWETTRVHFILKAFECLLIRSPALNNSLGACFKGRIYQ